MFLATFYYLERTILIYFESLRIPTLNWVRETMILMLQSWLICCCWRGFPTWWTL